MDNYYNGMKKIIIFIFSIFLLSTSLPAFAAESFMFLCSGSGAYLSTKDFTTKVVINSGGSKGINAADGTIRFDPKFLKVKSITTDKSVFKLWTSKPSFNNTIGTITFGGGLPKSYTDTAGDIFFITFTPQRSGKTKTSFATSSVLSADGKAKNILKEADDGFFILGNSSAVADSRALSKKMSGRILLQVEKDGRSWYVYPDDNRRYYMGRPLDAFNLMRKLGLGVTHSFIKTFEGKAFPLAMSGRILLDVEDSGKAYYINPLDRKAYYLGRPKDAFQIMRQLGLGITNALIDKIPNWAI
jgi:hypothetical protein